MMSPQEVPISQRTRRGSEYTFYNASGNKRTIKQDMSVEPVEIRGLPIRLNLEYCVYKFCMHTSLRLWILGESDSDDDCMSDGGRTASTSTSSLDSTAMSNCVLFKEYDRHAHISDSNKDGPVRYPMFPQIFSDDVVHNKACENGVATETEIHANCPTCHEKAKQRIEEMSKTEMDTLVAALAGIAVKVEADMARTKMKRERMIDMLARAERRLTFPMFSAKDLQHGNQHETPISVGL